MNFPWWQGRANSPYATVTVSVLAPAPVVTTTGYIPNASWAGKLQVIFPPTSVTTTLVQVFPPTLTVEPVANRVPTITKPVMATVDSWASGVTDVTVGMPTSVAQHRSGS